jgi:hypothetical protein
MLGSTPLSVPGVEGVAAADLGPRRLFRGLCAELFAGNESSLVRKVYDSSVIFRRRSAVLWAPTKFLAYSPKGDRGLVIVLYASSSRGSLFSKLSK